MQKNSITNKITPCCGLPFSIMYWFIQNLNLNTESDREFILSKLNQNGTISKEGWIVLINSSTLETDSAMTKVQFLEILNCKGQPNCNELKLIIEGFEVGNYNPVDEFGVGWTEEYVFEDFNDKIIKKIVSYSGGVGQIPAELNDRIGKYFGNGNLTLDQNIAIDFKPIFEPYSNDGIKKITDWNFPFKNLPTAEIQRQVSYSVKELYINNYDSNYNYYLIGFARNLDLSAYGYSANEYVIKLRKIHKVTLVAETWKLQFGNNSAISDIPAKLSYLDKFSIYVDWSKFPEGGNFDVDEAPAYLLTDNLTNKKSFPNLFPQNIKENNDGKNVYLYGSGSGAVGGEFNLGIGKESMSQIVDASYNLAIGRRAMKNHQSGAGNIAIGMDCMLNSVECIDVTMIGWEAGKNMIQGVGDTGVGRRALGLTTKSGGNTAFGDSTLYSIQYDSVSGNGGQNVAIGYTAGEYCINLKNSILIGLACARNLVGGSQNVILGDQAMLNRTVNSVSNVAIGGSTMLSSTGNQNVVIGSYTMANNVGGNENVVVGYNAGNSLTNGARNVFLGNSVGSGGTNVSDSIGIGNNVKPTKSNQIMLGSGIETEFVICGVEFTKAQLVALKALVS